MMTLQTLQRAEMSSESSGKGELMHSDEATRVFQVNFPETSGLMPFANHTRGSDSSSCRSPFSLPSQSA